MPRPQDIYYDYEARQRYLRQSAVTASRHPRTTWPPPPKAEDEAVSLAHEYKPGLPDIGGREARSRGSLDQQPIILDAYPPSSGSGPSVGNRNTDIRFSDRASIKSRSSEDSLGPQTPTDSESSNQDRRYVFIPQEGIEIPLTYDEPRVPIHEKRHQPQSDREQERGRQKSVPKIDTNLPRAHSSFDVPLRLERERSPYRQAHKTRETTATGEFLLSPEVMSPKNRQSESQHHPVDAARRGLKENDRKTAEVNIKPSSRPDKPSMVRHASAMAYPGEPKSIGTPQRPSVAKADRPSNLGTLPVRFVPNHNETSMLSPGSPHSPRRSSAAPSGDHSIHQRQDQPSTARFGVHSPRSSSMSYVTSPASAGTLSAKSGLQSLDAMLSNNSSDRRRASPRPSPQVSPQGSRASSPHSSPPQTPTKDPGNHRDSYFSSHKHSLPTSRPSSPLVTSAHRQLEPTGRETKHVTNSRALQESRPSSLFPSTATETFDSSTKTRINVRSPSPANHRRSSTYSGEEIDKLSSWKSQAEEEGRKNVSLRPAEVHQRRRSFSATPGPPPVKADHSRMAAPAEAANSRHLSLKSPASIRTASVGAPPAKLPPCPRPSPVAGYTDWSSLHNFPNFTICPTCLRAASETGYGRYFEPSFSRSPERPLQCAFSIPWIRMAYLLMVKKRKANANLLYDMADVADRTHPCPGNRPTVREWHRISDLDSDRNIPGFYACSYCVRSLETVFPVLEGVFHKSKRHHAGEERTCSLRWDSSRFAIYVDSLENVASLAQEHRRAPNPYQFLELLKSMGPVRPCSRDDMVRGQAWHIIPQLPEFTACAECYEDVIWPAVARGSDLASRFIRKPKVIGVPHAAVSCQLYSTRTREIFREACETQGYEYLREMALKRHKIERDLQNRIVEAQRYPRAQREKAMAEIVEQWQEWE
ncbi:MAG: hypothetical protein LQ351_001466 [Letrouitia transgressa]|nr:MAG: hypothetical protein LQ351_001466 [Letrouitia transgressa]